MSAQHTPGPWHNNGIDLIDGGPRFGANLFTTQVGEPISDSEMYANARLIAAAPDLLESLQSVLDWIDNWTPDFVQDEMWPADAERYRAAIAKARGQA